MATARTGWIYAERPFTEEGKSDGPLMADQRRLIDAITIRPQYRVLRTQATEFALMGTEFVVPRTKG